MKKLSTVLKKPWAATLLAIVFGFIVATFVLLFSGCNPLECFSVMFKMIFTRPKNMINVVVAATPLILTGVGISFAYKVGLFNIGAEGQYIMGSIVAAMVGAITDFPAVIEYPLVILSGVVAGMLYAAIVGLLKAKSGIHEVITGIMLNWIAFYFSNYISGSSWFHEPSSVHTKTISDSAIDIIYRWKTSEAGLQKVLDTPLLREMVGKTNINFGILFAIAVAIIISFILRRTTLGYQMRAVGKGAPAAEFAGINVNKNIILSMMISGAIVGLAGALQVVGVSHYVSTLSAFENYGFNGLSVALIASAAPIGCIFAGLLFAALSFGGGMIQTFVGAPSEVINIMIGTIVFFVALSKIIPVLSDKLSAKAKKKEVTRDAE